MPEKFEVGDIVVCMDDSLHGGYDDKKRLELGKIYEVSGLGGGEVYLRGIEHWTWKQARFRRATLEEARQYRRGQGYEKHPFAVGDIVVGICGDKWFGKSFCVKSATTDYDGEPMVTLDGECSGGLFAARFRKATPAEVEAYRRAKEKMVTIQIGDSQPFTAVDVTPIQEKPKDTLDASVSARPSGVAWASKAELAPTFNVTFTWEGPEKMLLTGNDAPEEINKAIAVPNPQMLTSADGREFDIIDWKPTVSTGEVVKVEANMVVRQAKDKPKSLYDGLVGAWAPKPAAPAWRPKPGDLVVCKDAEHSSGVLEAGKVYEVSGKVAKCDRGGEKIVLQGTSLGVGRESGWYTKRFRKATPAERFQFFKEKLNKEGPGDGYRFLDKEERLDESDEVFDAQKGTWVPTIRVGETAGTGPNRYRRRNKFAEGELVQIIKPATEQERNSDPVWTPMMDLFDGAVFPMPATDPITSERDGIYHAGWVFAVDWLAPATKDQKVKKAKIQELEARMKDIQSELSSLKGT